MSEGNGSNDPPVNGRYDRQPDGRFKPGNRAAKGNATYRRMAELRALILDAVDPADVQKVMEKLRDLALIGDVPACRVYLDHVMGKPPQSVDLSGWAEGLEGAQLVALVLATLAPFPAARAALTTRLASLGVGTVATTFDLMLWGLDASALFRAIGLRPDPWQVEFLRSDAPRVLMLAHRQAGKSTVVAVKALHVAIFKPGSLVLIASPTQNQSNELFRKLGEVYEALGRPLPAVQENAVTLGLANGSRVVSLPGSPRTVRGYSAPAMVIIDEAAQADDGLFVALPPMLATVPDSPMVWVSTPWGQRGEFHRAWEDEAGDWVRFKITADRNPRISPAFLAAERHRLGPRYFGQEFLCQFNSAIDQYFSTESVLAAYDETVKPLFGG